MSYQQTTLATDGGAEQRSSDLNPYDRPTTWQPIELFDTLGPCGAIGADEWDRKAWHHISADVPDDRQTQVIDLAERLLRAGGARTGFGHHEEIRRSMEQWAPGRDDDDPKGRRTTVFSMSPDERNFGRLSGEPAEKEQKAITVIEWARSEFPEGVFEVIAEEQLDDAREAWRTAAEEARRADIVEAFRTDPPAELNGWERFESDKPDVTLAYRANSYGTPSVAFVYETEDGLDAHESTLGEWNEAETGAESKVNRHFVDPTRDELDPVADLYSHLQTFDVEPLGVSA